MDDQAVKLSRQWERRARELEAEVADLRKRCEAAEKERAGLLADEQLLVDLFRSDEFKAEGQYGDHNNLRPCETATRTIKQLKAKCEAAEKENRRMKALIESYGNNPAGFDWGVLGQIDELEKERDAAQAAAAKMRPLVEEFSGWCNEALPSSGGVWLDHNIAFCQQIEKECEAALATDAGKSLLAELEAARRVCEWVKTQALTREGAELLALWIRASSKYAVPPLE